MASRKKSMARSMSRESTPARSVASADKSRQGYAKERPAIPTKISMAYGAPGRVTMPQRLNPKTKKASVADAIQEALDEDESAAQENTEPSALAANQADSDDEDDDEDEDADENEDEHEEQTEKPEQTKQPRIFRRTVTPSARQTLTPQPRETGRSFAVEDQIANEARLHRPAVPLRVRFQNLQNYLSEQWNFYGGPTALEYLIVFLKVFFIVGVLALSIQNLRPYLPAVRFTMPSIKGPVGGGILSDSKSILNSRPLTALQDSTNHQFNLLRARIDSLELSYNRLATSVSAPPSTHKVNFFALGSGVVIDAYLTSPTRRGSDGFQLVDVWHFLRGLPAWPRAPAFMALTAWDDMGDCWCAPDSGGKAQLALSLQKWIVPQELVVEHIPMKATLDSGTAPKDIELWVQILDPQRRDAVAKAALQYKITSPEIENQTDTYSTKKSLDATWVRVGRWQYDIYSPNNVQSFQIPVPMEHFEAPVNRLAIRTLSNWGNDDHVCLYRLKLHGLVAKEASPKDATE